MNFKPCEWTGIQLHNESEIKIDLIFITSFKKTAYQSHSQPFIIISFPNIECCWMGVNNLKRIHIGEKPPGTSIQRLVGHFNHNFYHTHQDQKFPSIIEYVRLPYRPTWSHAYSKRDGRVNIKVVFPPQTC